MEPEFQAQFDARHRVLLIAMGPRLTRENYLRAYAAVRRFVAAEGPCSMIFDVSAVTDFQFPAGFEREIAAMEPAVPPSMRRFAVAPQAAIFGSARIVETLRSETAGPVNVVRSLADAFVALGASPTDFVPLASL